LNMALDERPRWPLQLRSCFRRMHDSLRRVDNTPRSMKAWY
jgi:hypothetical protein